MRIRRIAFAALLILALSSVGTAVSAADSDIAQGATEFMVPMRDGVKLATNVFLPEGDGPWPVVWTRTPYGEDGRMSAGWQRYTSAGLAYVSQDCRGKFRSEGEYRPFEDDREDGYDTVEWIAEQEFSNGKIGMSHQIG